MASATRLLSMLAMLGTRPSWTSGELAERLEITERTVRRDITELRNLGYPVHAAPGAGGGYQLGAGGKVPPLLLDDDEAVAVAIGLSAMVGAGSMDLAQGAVSALSKLGRVLPPRLRERVAALQRVTLALRRTEIPDADIDLLVRIAVACERPERLRFDYRDASDTTSHRHVEPYRLVFTDRRWYLVAFDTGRRAWRTFRVDRMSDVDAGGVTFTRSGELPDASAQVAEGVALWGYDLQVTVRFHAGRDEVTRFVDATVGVLGDEVDGCTIARIGGDAEWIARYLASSPHRFEVIDAPEVDAALCDLGARLQRDHHRDVALRAGDQPRDDGPR